MSINKNYMRQPGNNFPLEGEIPKEEEFEEFKERIGRMTDQEFLDFRHRASDFAGDKDRLRVLYERLEKLDGLREYLKNPRRNSPERGEIFDCSGHGLDEYDVALDAPKTKEDGTEDDRKAYCQGCDAFLPDLIVEEGKCMTHDIPVKLLEIKGQKEFRDFFGKLTGAEKWLDLGSGRGTSLPYFLARNHKINNLTAVDISRKNLEYDQRRGFVDSHETGHDLTLNRIQADAAALPFTDASFDYMITEMMMADNPTNELKKSAEISQEIERVLKDNGVLIVDECTLPWIDEDKFEHLFAFGKYHSKTFLRKKTREEIEAQKLNR